MKSVILSNFHPILVGKLIDQTKLNQYTKFLYYHFQNTPESDVSGSDAVERISFESISDHVDKYSVSSESINSRQILIFEDVENFIENEMDVALPS